MPSADSGRFAIALDVGTSKIDGVLVEMPGGAQRSAASCANRQFRYGTDVISRLNFALKGAGGMQILHRLLMETIDEIVDELVEKAGIDGNGVAEILCVGNSAMHHLALSIAPRTLAAAPFKPSGQIKTRVPSYAFGRAPNARLDFLPSLGGFVGSDAVAVIIASGMHASDELCLAVDIGSNGEVMLGNAKKILVASTSAGPAFEGWGVSCGMPAVNGAIDSIKVRKDKTVIFTTIGEAEPAGVCGSALIDLLKDLLDLKLLDSSGRIRNDRFRIHDDLFLTQRDVRELQLAKAAIQAAVSVLRRRLPGEIAHVFLTGRFGSRLSRENAQAIGIVPDDIRKELVRFLPHGALEGARMILCSEKANSSAMRLYKSVVHVELHKEYGFQDAFVGSMVFS